MEIVKYDDGWIDILPDDGDVGVEILWEHLARIAADNYSLGYEAGRLEGDSE